MAIDVGDKAPDFTMLDETGVKVKLSEFRGKRVVLFFYPRADTPGCTRESCDFRDEVDAFKKKKVAVLGVSKDKPAAQAKFKEKYQLPFQLLSDESLAVMKAYGVWKEKNMYGKKVMGCERSTFIIGADGKIEHAYRKVKVDGHAANVLAEV